MLRVFIWEKVWLENSLSQTFSHINTPTFLEPSSFFTPAYEDGTDGVFRNVGISNSDTGNYPEESIQHSEHSESLK